MMFKKQQNSKSTIYLGVFLILTLLFQGCRQRETLPEPNTEAHKALTIAQAKSWFGRYKALLRSQKTTSDSLERVPDWEQIAYQVTTEPTPKVYLEMPLLYDEQNEIGTITYPNGTKGKGYTKIILMQTSPTEFKPVVMRFYARESYLQQPHPALETNTFTSLDPNFSGDAFFYDWTTGDFLLANRFEQGKWVATTQSTDSTAQQRGNQECETFILAAEYYLISDYGARDMGRDKSSSGSGDISVTFCWYTPSSSGGSGSGGSSSGGYSGGGGSGVFYPPINTIPNIPDFLDPAFAGILSPNAHRVNKIGKWQALNHAFKSAHDKSCIVRQIIAQIKASGRVVVLDVNTTLPDLMGGRVMGSHSADVTFVNGQICNAMFISITSAMIDAPTAMYDPLLNSVLYEELIHGLQGATYTDPTLSSSNKEFEAKFLIDLINRLNGDKVFTMNSQAFDGKKNDAYEDWLYEITEGYTKIPVHEKIMEKYWEMLNIFTNQYPSNHPYGKLPSNHQPNMMKNVLDVARNTPNCK